ncbi:polysaccharide deacetylase family protein [Cerasicoccus frondis]|uniref:polysaccharide deacetylase family protein n=1 Tax=Cerasicoccus frondis TaxID=490090 RepID=UPI0028524DAE|nr:polysaccharide deacetylase family protein [Cerasicoccus frondis]
MKILHSFIAATIMASGLIAAQADEPYIAPYYNDRQAAFSFTFDDGFQGNVDNTLEIIDPLGIKGTFFVIPNRVGQNPVSINWKQVKQIQATGHEIGTHDAIKPRLHEIPIEQVREKVSGGSELIEMNTAVRSVSFAMPGGSKKTPEILEVIKEKHYFYRNREDLPNVVIAGYGSAGKRIWEDDKARKQIEQTIDNGGWYIPVVHAIVKGYSPFNSKEEFKTHCEWLLSKEDVLWIAPMGVVGRYVFERDAAKLTVTQQSANAITFTLTHSLGDKEIFNHPLTVVIPGTSATSAKAADASGNTLDASVSNEKILVNAMPDGQPITVTW